jgi:lysophospholipase L1-like esterase
MQNQDKAHSKNAEWAKRAGLLVFASVLSLGVLEIGLRAFTAYPNDRPGNNRIDDPALGYRLTPGAFDTGDDGFRPPMSERAAGPIDLLAVGDSHTFGAMVRGTESWPDQLAVGEGWRYRNWSAPGYNVRQYAVLIERAETLAPARIVLAVYPYNDLEGYCVPLGAALPSTCPAPRPAPYQAPAPSLAMASAWRDVGKRWATGDRFGLKSAPDVVRAGQGRAATGFALAPRAEYLVRLAEQRAEIDAAQAFTATLFSQLGERSRQVLIAIVPSRERVYRAAGALPKGHSEIDELLAFEAHQTERLLAAADSAGLKHCDLAPDLIAAVANGERVYFDDDNSHPSKRGYALYAQAIRQCLSAEGG